MGNEIQDTMGVEGNQMKFRDGFYFGLGFLVAQVVLAAGLGLALLILASCGIVLGS